MTTVRHTPRALADGFATWPAHLEGQIDLARHLVALAVDTEQAQLNESLGRYRQQS